MERQQRGQEGSKAVLIVVGLTAQRELNWWERQQSKVQNTTKNWRTMAMNIDQAQLHGADGSRHEGG